LKANYNKTKLNNCELTQFYFLLRQFNFLKLNIFLTFMKTTKTAKAILLPIKEHRSKKSILSRSVFQSFVQCTLAGFLTLFIVSTSLGQIAQRGSATTATSTTTSVTVNKPAGLAVGDLMLVTINQSTNNSNVSLSNSGSTGWQLLAGERFYESGNDEWWGTVLYRIATSTDVTATSFQFTGDSDADDMQASIVAFSGVDQTNPIDVAGTFTSSTDDNTSLSANSITTTTPNTAVILLAMISNDRDFNSNWSATSPSFLTELFDVPFNADEDMGIGGAWAIKPSPGATGNGTVTLSDNARDGALLISLRPAPGSIQTVTFTSNGTFTVPNCVTSLTVEAWGGGGGGFDGNSSGGGKGGGGGGYAKGTITSASGVYAVVVGTGGDMNSNGTASTFGSTLLIANGGNGGTNQTSGGGAGGTATTSGVSNATTTKGGNGGNGNNTGDVGGGGGGAGGPNGNGANGANGASNVGGNGGNGNNGSGGNGGNGGDGGNGANGSTNVLGGGGGGGGDDNENGGYGGFPGGGGGGGEDGGGQGADGLVRVTYTLPNNPTITLTNTTASSCFSASAQNVTLAYSTTTGCPDKYSIDFASGISDVTNANLSGTPITIVIPAGLAVGTYSGSLNVTNSTYGFVSSSYSITITVTAAPNAGTLSGTQALCSNETSTLASTVSGGAWSSSATGIATINSSTGVVSGVSAGTATMTYTVTGTGGCSNATATRVVTVTQPTTSITIDGNTINDGDYLWGGNINTNGNVPGNWYVLNNGSYSIPNQVPQPNHEVFVINASAGSCIFNDLTVPNAGSFSSENIYIGANATVTFANGASINVKGNFINNGNFNAGSGTVTMNGSTAQSIGGSAATTFNNLIINNSAGVSLNVIGVNNNPIVNGTLTLTNGRLSLGSNNLILGTTASIAGTPSASNMIVISGSGELRKRFPSGISNQLPFTFPVGTTAGGNEYTPVELDFNSGNFSSEAYVGVRVVDQRSSFMSNSIVNYVNRNWIVEPSGITSPNYDITLHYVQSDWIGDAGAEGNVLPIKYSTSSGTGMWYQPESAGFTNAESVGSGFGNSTANFLNWESVTSFSQFGGAEGNNQPLPVELVSFSGTCEEGNIHLTWKTASEFNSSHFDVEKSRDGENWQLLTLVPSAGTSNELLTYHTVDQNATDGNNYYRLRQVDIDGTEKFYDPINVSCTEVTPGYFTSFPNPSGTSFQVIVNNKELIGTCVLNIVDATGKVIDQREIEMNDGINMFVINQELTPGIYFMNVSNGTKSTSVLRHAVK
jgi:hypothetical protein